MTARIGILGLGSIGRTHARAIRQLAPRLELAAYTSSRPGDPEIVGDAAWLTPAELLAADLDLVVIATPSNDHGSQALDLLAHGKGLVVEKPIATTAAEARAVVAAWRESGRFGAAIAQRRLEPQHVALKGLMDSGRLGRPLLAEVSVCWWRSPEYYAQAPWRALPPGGGVLMNQALHSVDLLTWLLGPAASVAALTGNLAHPIACEDTAVAAVRLTGGALATITATTATPPGHPATLRVYTDRGSFALDHAAIAEWHFEGVPAPAEAPAVSSGAGDPAGIGIQGHLAQWTDIAEALETGRPPAIPLDQGLPVIELIDAIYTSARTGSTVAVGGAG